MTVLTALENEVPFILVPDVNADSIHDMGVIFTRLNKQGMQMSGEEIFFSSLKVELPDAHDLVWNIYADKTVGKILPPSKIVHIGSRIVAKKIKSSLSLESVNTHVFRSLTKEKKDFISEFQKHLKEERFLTIFKKTRLILEYNKRINPSGLPVPVLQFVKDSCWHVLSVWIDKNFEELNDSVFLDRNRSEILRYVFMEVFFVWRSRQWIRQSNFDKITKEKANFPGEEIYKLYQQHCYLTELLPKRDNVPYIPPPEKYEECIKGNGENWLLGYQRNLMLWAQRDVIKTWFPDYDPTIFLREEDKPYDFDHILPQEDGSYSKEFAQNKEYGPQYRHLLNCIGNLRIWPKGANRRDQNIMPIKKNNPPKG